jgi:hypothetical protein
MVQKSSDRLLFETLHGSVSAGKIPFLVFAGGTRSNLRFLPLPNTEVQTVSIGAGYQLASWNALILQYTFGDYLGGSIRRIDGELKIPPTSRINLGLSGFRVQSPLDDLLLLQLFGEAELFLKGLFLKPYVSYQNDRLRNQKRIFVNGILLYEPRFLTGIYLALNRQFAVDPVVTPLSNKEVFKIQFGYTYY